MRQLTQKQRKIAIIVVITLVVVHFAPGFARGVLTSIAARKAAARAQTLAASTPKPMTPAIAPKPAGVPLEVQMRYLGKWEGKSFNLDNDVCHISLEIRLDPLLPGYVSAYETKICFNVPAYPGAQNHPLGLAEAMRQASPVSTVMSGSPVDGDLEFTIGKTIGTSSFQCPHASYGVATFGQKNVVAQWRDIDCPAGNMVLTRVGA